MSSSVPYCFIGANHVVRLPAPNRHVNGQGHHRAPQQRRRSAA